MILRERGRDKLFDKDTITPWIKLQVYCFGGNNT